MSTLSEEKVLSVHHWTDRLFSFKTTRSPAFRYENGQFTMIGLEVNGKPREVRAGTLAELLVELATLGPALRRIKNNNAQSEYYLTDVVEVLTSVGHRAGAMVADAAEVTGVNDRWQLALAERELRARTNRSLLLAGVTMLDPRQTFIDVTVQIGRDVTLFPGVILQGATSIGDGCVIGPSARLSNTQVGANCRIEQTTARDSVIGDDCEVGPYAFLPEGTKVESGASTGAFYDGSR